MEREYLRLGRCPSAPTAGGLGERARSRAAEGRLEGTWRKFPRVVDRPPLRNGGTAAPFEIARHEG